MTTTARDPIFIIDYLTARIVKLTDCKLNTRSGKPHKQLKIGKLHTGGCCSKHFVVDDVLYDGPGHLVPPRAGQVGVGQDVEGDPEGEPGQVGGVLGQGPQAVEGG